MKKPSLCTTCEKNEEQKEEMLCTLNRIDQQDENEFKCEAYISEFEENTNQNEEISSDDEGIKF